jgi:pantetheine-phosphate adenylyltransferase
MSSEKHRTGRKIGIYPGTFDPMTAGHIDVLLRAKNVVDEIVVAISTASNKSAMFTPIERSKIIGTYLDKYKAWENVKIVTFEGLLVNFAASVNANIIIRGIRAVSDFEYEFQMSCMNSRLNPNIQTIFLPASERNQFVSSSLVKEIYALGGDVSELIIPEVEVMIKDKIG